MKPRRITLWAWALMWLPVLAFALWPQLDIQISRLFYADSVPHFPADHLPWILWLHLGLPWLARWFFLLGVLLLLVGMYRPWRLTSRWRRPLVAWMLLVVLGNGLVVDLALKDGMGRPRPEDVTPLGGSLRFVPILQKSQLCDVNCSFVSGHAALGFGLVAWGIWTPWARRKRWAVMAISAGLLIGWMRVAQGGHFASDVWCAGVIMVGLYLLLRRAWLAQRLRAIQRHRVRAHPPHA